MSRRTLIVRVCVAVFLCLALGPRSAAQSPVSVNRIHTIYVASMGEGASADALRSRIVDRLKRSASIKVVESAASADVELRGSSSIWPTGTISISPRSNAASETVFQGYLSCELADSANRVLWSYLVTPSRLRTTGITDDLADQMAAHLLDAIHDGVVRSGSLSTPGHSQVELHGAGSTLAAPLYMKWFQSSGIPVTYDAIGSEAGIEQLAAGKVDFAGSDIPQAAGLKVLYLPTVVGGVVPIYNLLSPGRALRLTPQMLAGIYSGAIRKWNDPRIVEFNRGIALPDAEIAVVHRTDGSGTTYVWTSALSLASPEWKAGAGAGPRVNWPVGEGANGNAGVAELVQKTPNSIGYVELIYAIQHQLNYAAVRNPAGEFVKADLASITAAAAGVSEPGRGEGLRLSILDAPGKSAYPISTFTWLLVPVDGLNAEKKAALADLLNWTLTSGQKQCASLGYAPLPRQIVARELKALSAWKGASR